MERRYILTRMPHVLCVVFLLVNVASQMILAYTGPEFPEPQLGRIYPLRVHYTVVYITQGERLLAGYLTLALAVVFGVISVVIDVKSKRTEPRP